MPLDPYRSRRNFEESPEPKGRRRPQRRHKLPVFVVQKHQARQLHYDLRLEFDGVLKSWAIPKGPCLDPSVKRLAVEVEEHPLEYADFEGAIAAGQYGAGAMIVWDRGHWRAEDDAHEAYAGGTLKFVLEGTKLRGRWMLLRIRPGRGEADRTWLLVKERDAEARVLEDYDVLIEPASVASGRTLEEVSKEEPAAEPARRRRRSRQGTCPVAAARIPEAFKAALPQAIKPQLAQPSADPPEGNRWLHEIKYDGYRLVTTVADGMATIRTRRGVDWTARFAPLADALRRLPVRSAVLDGEIVALLPNGVSSFAALKNAFREGTVGRLIYFVFDLLYLDGYDLRKARLEKRKEALALLLAGGGHRSVQYADHVAGEGVAFFAQCRALGLEGMVSKRLDRPYRSGRSADWRKVKINARDEFVIGGFTISAQRRAGLKAILVGYFDKGKLRYAGRVGTGFTHDELLEMRRSLESQAQQSNPFDDLPREKIETGTHWMKPRLVAQVEYSGWTDEGLLWHPRFRGLRDDLRAIDVRRDPPTVQQRAGIRGSSPPRSPETGSRAGSGSDELAAALQRVHITNPNRVMYDDLGIAKIDLVRYYVEIGQWMLPHLIGRPISLVRCPQGVAQKHFYQKHPLQGMPQEIRRIACDRTGEPDEAMMIDGLAGLIALVQFSALEIHPWGARADQPNRPDRLILDLDPGEAVPWSQVIDGAFRVRALLEGAGWVSFVKTSGSRGLHVVVPLVRRHAWQDVRDFSQALAQRLSRQHRTLFTASSAKWARSGRVYVDYLRNRRGATTVAAYSTRALAGAPVSVPVSWEELPTILQPAAFSILNTRERLAELPRDPWEELAVVRQSITAIAKRATGQ